jgi:predicted RNase H-like HicB family nuclease
VYFCIQFIQQKKRKETVLDYSIIIEKNPETGWYCGQCTQLPEAMSQGRSIDELVKNMKEAIELAIECRKEELKSIYQNRKHFYRRITVNV